MSHSDCPRCNGTALPQYKHVAGGRCFRCGRTLAGESQGSRPATQWTRWRIIEDLRVRIENAKRHDERGFASARAYFEGLEDPEGGITLTQLLTIAPADVRARAEAAIAALCG